MCEDQKILKVNVVLQRAYFKVTKARVWMYLRMRIEESSLNYTFPSSIYYVSGIFRHTSVLYQSFCLPVCGSVYRFHAAVEA